MSGLNSAVRPEGRWTSPPLSAASRSEDSIHIAVASSETSTTEPSPVRVRLSRAAAIPNASAIAPLRSPIAPRWLIG